MRKILLTFTAICFSASLFAGGLVTNTNQSAHFTRMLSKNASILVDATYYNPAGLTKLSNGFHFSLSNQIIKQTKTITSNYSFLNELPDGYIGDVKAPFFPSLYGVYRVGKLAISVGVNPIGGGGGAEYNNGLPQFEMDIAELVPLLSSLSLPTTAYSADIYLKGSSIYFGYQANVSYEINDMLSVAVGGRFVSAKNTTQGHIKNIQANPGHPLVNPTGAMLPISGFFTTIGQDTYAAMTADRDVDVEITGSGFTPILSVNISPADMLNVAIRYEAKTNLTLTTEVIDNKGGGIYVDGTEVVADMPALLAVGVDVRPMDKLLLSASATMFMDKNNDYDGSADLDINMIDKNFLSYSFGAEYAINKMFKVSAGYSGTQTGVNENYQSDLRYSLNTSSFGGGIGISVTPMIDINLGAMMTNYDAGTNDVDRGLFGTAVETYDTETIIFAIGVDVHF